MATFRIVLLTLAAAVTAVASAGDNLKSCLEHAVNDSSRVAFPGGLFYQEEVDRYNLNIPVTPAALTYPVSSQQVAAIVKCAADNDYPVQAKSGGHSYGNYGEFGWGASLQGKKVNARFWQGLVALMELLS